MEKFIELVQGANWEAIGALALVIIAAAGQFFRGFLVSLEDKKPAPAPVVPPPDDQSSFLKSKQWEEVIQDIKVDTHQLVRNNARDHLLLVEISDSIARIEGRIERIKETLKRN